MKPRCLDEASIEKGYVCPGFLKVLDEHVSKTIGFSRFLSCPSFLTKSLQISMVLAHFFLKNIKTPRFWTFFLHEAQMPWRSFHWKRLFLPRVFKNFGWTCIKNHSFYKVFELCIILGKNLANTKGFGTCFWKIFKKHVGFGRPS